MYDVQDSKIPEIGSTFVACLVVYGQRVLQCVLQCVAVCVALCVAACGVMR